VYKNEGAGDTVGRREGGSCIWDKISSDDGLDVVRTALCLLGGHHTVPCLGIQPSQKLVLNPGSTPGAEVAVFLDW